MGGQVHMIRNIQVDQNAEKSDKYFIVTRTESSRFNSRREKRIHVCFREHSL